MLTLVPCDRTNLNPLDAAMCIQGTENYNDDVNNYDDDGGGDGGYDDDDGGGGDEGGDGGDDGDRFICSFHSEKQEVSSTLKPVRTNRF